MFIFHTDNYFMGQHYVEIDVLPNGKIWLAYDGENGESCFHLLDALGM